MVKIISTFTLSAAICLIAQGLLSLPANPSEEPQVPHLTLRIPISTAPMVHPESGGSLESLWKLCESANGRATGRPFGFNQVRYRNSGSGIEIFGCITNNSGRAIDTPFDFLFETTITSPAPRPLSGRVSPEGRLLSHLVTLGPIIPPGHTRFFSGLFLPNDTNTATTFIKRSSPPGQSKTYAPVQRLDIAIVR